MAIVSVIVMFLLQVSLFFLLSLSFGVEREKPSQQSFGGIAQPFILRKILISVVLALTSTGVIYWLDSIGMFDGLFRP